MIKVNNFFFPSFLMGGGDEVDEIQLATSPLKETWMAELEGGGRRG